MVAVLLKSQMYAKSKKIKERVREREREKKERKKKEKKDHYIPNMTNEYLHYNIL